MLKLKASLFSRKVCTVHLSLFMSRDFSKDIPTFIESLRVVLRKKIWIDSVVGGASVKFIQR